VQPRTAKKYWLMAEEIYRQTYGTPDGLLPVSFEILYAIGWAPHNSQPQPLRRGSAQNSLAEALGSTEISTGEKPE
jgi:NADH dehydrogenase [ubiquinone] 1 alpha subcomplex assembly factor 5